MFYLLVIAVIPVLCRSAADDSREKRIVGGEDVDYGKYPFVVRLVSIFFGYHVKFDTRYTVLVGESEWYIVVHGTCKGSPLLIVIED